MSDVAKVAEAISRSLASPKCPDQTMESGNVVDGLYEVAQALRFGAKELGKEGASGPGAIEFLGTCINEGCCMIAGALDNLAEAVRESQE